MRLIDADELEGHIKILGIWDEVENKDVFTNDIKDAILKLIDAQPTAYDPDKVVEQLEERTSFLKDCTKYGNQTTDQQSKSYDTMMMYEVKDLVYALIEIVKGGGTDGN